MFSVSTTDLNDFHENLIALTQELIQQLEYLNALIDNLHLTWTGEATTAQRHAHETIAKNYQAMIEYLQ